MWNKKRRPDSKGFTLLEIMVALAVISISLVVLLGLRNRDLVLSATARDMTKATMLARKKITEIHMSSFPDLGEKKGRFGEEAPEFRWRQEVVQTPFEAVREMVLEVSWGGSEDHEEEKDGQVSFTSYLFDGT